jgi:hypothetical protein
LENAAENYFHAVKLARVLREDEREVVHHKSLITNFFACHHESGLLGMLTNEHLDIRKSALSKILKARQLRKIFTHDLSIRKFICPKQINFDAECFSDMINWTSLGDSITEPPLTCVYTKQELIQMVENNSFDFSDYPSNTQAVERMVKLETKS